MSNGIDFVIGGKDKAKPAMASVEQSLARLEGKTNRLQTATQGLMAAMGPLIAVFAAVKTAMAIGSTITSANEAYDQQIASVEGLEVALGLQGAAVETESARLQTFASDMQKLTGIGDEVTLGLMRQASMLGVNADQLDDAAKAAIGLSEASGRSLQESLKLVNNAMAGQFESFGEVIPQIRDMQTQEEKLAAVLALSQKGLDAKAESSKTVAGASEKASGAIGDLMESVGALLAPVRILISAGLQTLAESLQTVLVPAVQWAEEVLANIGPLMDWVKEKVIAAVNAIIGAFTFFEVILTNLDSVWELVVAVAERALLQMSGAVMHALTEVIPAYAAWFAENFVNLIRDGLSGAFTVVVNGIAKLVDAFVVLWDFIASGGDSDVLGRLGEISGRSYLDGFQSSLTGLPEIVGRAISAREQELSEVIGQIGGDLGQQFADKMADRMVESAAGISDEFSNEIDLQLGDGLGGKQKSPGAQILNASESRLLTRGRQRSIPDMLEKIDSTLEDIRNNTKDKTILVPLI